MRQALNSSGLTDEDRFHLDFALGKALHDVGQPDEAFAHFSKANALRLKTAPYDPARIGGIVDRCIAGFTSQAFAERPGGSEARDPIFIVGMPRAGSTLVEQILSSHSLVEGTSELPDIPALARKTDGYPDGALRAPAEERHALGEEYLKRAGPEADELDDDPSPVKAPPPAGFQPKQRDPDAPRRARAYVAALGGRSNIVRVDACAETRLRLVVRDRRYVQEPALKAEGIAALVAIDSQTLHLLAGLNADQYAAEMRGLLASGE